jgi:hypothetical protein
MAIDETTPRTRRAILAAALGAVGASIAGALGRPAAVVGANGDELIVGQSNNATSQTTLSTTAATGLSVTDPSPSAVAVSGATGASSGKGYGVRGRSAGSTGVGAVGHSIGNATGVLGVSGPEAGTVPAAKAKTGVYGQAQQDVNARGVWGKSTSGRGVMGEATSGTGVRGEATTGTGVVATAASNGTALRVVGKASFNRSGIITVPPGNISASKSIAVTTSTMVFAMIQEAVPGVWLRAALAHAGNQDVTVYLNKTTTVSTKVAYFLLG